MATLLLVLLTAAKNHTKLHPNPQEGGIRKLYLNFSLSKLHLHVSNKCGLLLLEFVLINDPNALNRLLELEVAIVVSTKQ